MLRAIAKALCLVCFAIAFIAAILDVTRSIADSSWVMTPFLSDWQRLNADSLAETGAFISQSLHEALWDPVLVTLLSIPTWALFAGLAVLLALAARRRRSRWQENFGA